MALSHCIFAVAVALAGVASSAAAQTLTRVGGEVHLSDLPPILAADRVAPELTKGLTTTFVFRVDLPGLRGGKDAGGGRVEVRYELWDEVFHLVTMGIDGTPSREQVDSMDALQSWWAALRLPILVDDSGSGAASVRLSLDVVPFSRAEEIETQRWFAESVRRAESASADSSAGIGEAEPVEAGVFELLIATSIRRRSLISYDWTLELPSADSP